MSVTSWPHSQWNSIISLNQPMFFRENQVIFHDLEKGKSKGGRPPRPDTIAPKSAANKREKRSQSCSRSGWKQRQNHQRQQNLFRRICFLNVEGSARVSRPETCFPVWGDTSSWRHSCVRMQHHGKRARVFLQRRSLRLLRTRCCCPSACVEQSSLALPPSFFTCWRLLQNSCWLKSKIGKICCSRRCLRSGLASARVSVVCDAWIRSLLNTRWLQYVIGILLQFYWILRWMVSATNQTNPNSSSLIFIFGSFREWLWQ